MKTYFFISLLFSLSTTGFTQVYSPVNTTGYNLDAVAETTTALSTTGGAIDGSNYVLYSASYGALYNVATGLPNSGVISAGTQTYQLQAYTQNNLLYVPAGLNDSLTLLTPAPYAGLSLLGFATEGSAAMVITVRFTDNTTQVFNSLSYADWFGTGTSVYSGFDRVTRNTGTPANLIGNPKMYNIELPITCANRFKNIQRIRVQNAGTNARVCIMAVSGALTPTFSTSTLPVTCSGGTNGSASITATGGILPYTYTWSTSPAQMTPQANNLPVGIHTYSAQDNGGCIFTGSVTVSQSLAVQPSLVVTSNTYSVCSGNTFTLGASGANTYTWVNNSNSFLYSPAVPVSQVLTTFNYSVAGLTSDNCYRTGSVNITVHPLPGAVFISSVPARCNNSAPLPLLSLVQPTTGVFSGPGVSANIFTPFSTGTFTLTYTNTSSVGCVSSATSAVQVFSLAAPIITTPNPQCINGPQSQMTVSPAGGVFTGTGFSSSGVFTPSVAGNGTHSFTYSITSGPCTSGTVANIIVNPAPVAILNPLKTFFCKNSPIYFFNAQPAGGVFSGPAMTGAAFDPSKANIGNTNIILYTFTDMNGCTDTASSRITVSNCTDIGAQTKNEVQIGMFPNPTKNSVVIQSSSEISMVLINELGQKIEEFQLNAEKDYKHIITSIKPGIYFLRPTDGSGIRVKKLVVLE